MNIDFDINEVTSDILGMIWEKLVELDGETGPISGVTTLFLRSFHDVLFTIVALGRLAYSALQNPKNIFSKYANRLPI